MDAIHLREQSDAKLCHVVHVQVLRDINGNS